MILLDVNVLVYAHREDSPHHQAYRPWLEDVLNGESAFGVSDLVLSGFLRVVTHPRVFSPPTPLPEALRFVEQIRTAPQRVDVRPGNRHFDIFLGLCQTSSVKGNLIADAFHAALAIEWGCEWITTDGDFARFAELRWSTPHL